MKYLHHSFLLSPPKDASTSRDCHLMDRRVHCNTQQTRSQFKVLMMSEKLMVQSVDLENTQKYDQYFMIGTKWLEGELVSVL